MSSFGFAKSDMHVNVQHNAEFETLLKIGFQWKVNQVEQGCVVRDETTHNLYPIEGLNATLDILLGSVGKLAGVYVGLYSGNYTPTIADVAATVSSASG